ncbi:mycothiol transferase [Streptomyces albireticuli]|uniref:mycothiol transferase n=1 Tax=Streptomyces albireticuli TaxID=1940 RepID=UPI003698C150
MTTMEPRPDLRPPGLNADEKTTLLTFLDYLREAVLAKAAGVPEPAVRTAGVPSGTSLLQLLKHLTAVELNWFVWAYAGADREPWEDEAAGINRVRLSRGAAGGRTTPGSHSVPEAGHATAQAGRLRRT